MDPSRLMTETLRAAPWGAQTAAILAAALAAVEPGAAVRRHMRREGDALTVGGRRYELGDYRGVWLVGAGKAGAAMAEAAAELLGERLSGGLVVVKGDLAPAAAGYELLPAAHPVPDARGVAAGERIADLLGGLGADDLVIALISGGGSALLTLPVAGVSLDDMRGLTAALLGCGARIDEINSLRKHLDRLKGGGLARMAQPATLVALVLSDVVGSPLDVIASGPTVPDAGSFAEAWAVLERYAIVDAIPAAARDHLARGVAGALPDTPKPGDPCFSRTSTLLVGDNRQAADAALAAARDAGMHTLLLTTYLQGEAREAGRVLAAVARELAASGNPLPRPACIVAGGETTVTLRGDGRGGRNQELALAAVADLAGLENVALVALATDGDDGPTDAAGAVVSGESLRRALAHGLDPAAHLARNDAYPFFAALGDLLRPGPSGTNVNDLTFLFAW
jgi:hydroxypyruvate reductase